MPNMLLHAVSLAESGRWNAANRASISWPWAHAVGRYHSGNWQGRGRHYWRKVRILWKKERIHDYKARRATDIKAFEKRRQKIARQYYR